MGAVPRWTIAVLVLALAAQIGWHAAASPPTAAAAMLPPPPSITALRVASFGEPIASAQWLTLYLQAFDNQPGISIPFSALDFDVVIAWLRTALTLDPVSQYPLMMAAQLYAQVPDAAKTRLMFEFVHEQFLLDPNRRWRWLAHAAITAKHRLNDTALALRYADDITRHASQASGWARQMGIFIRADLGQIDAATVLLGGLLQSGEVTDPAEIRFLSERLSELKAVEKSSEPSKSR